MSKLLVVLSLFFCAVSVHALTDVDDLVNDSSSKVESTSQVSGSEAILSIVETEESWIDGDSGYSYELKKDCSFSYNFNKDKDYLEVVISEEKNPEAEFAKFYFNKNINYTHDVKSYEDGFYRVDTFSVGNNEISFVKAADHYYEIRIDIQGEVAECNIDF